MTSTKKPRRIAPVLWDRGVDQQTWQRDAAWSLGAAVLVLVASVAMHAATMPSSAVEYMVLLSALLCLGALPMLQIWPGVLAGATLAAAYLLAGWAHGPVLVAPLLVLVVGHYAFLARRAAAKATEVAVKPASEEPRQVALRLKAEGKLDEAFEKLSRLPARGEVLRDLYHLGKAFERSRSLVRARDVFAHLAGQAPLYRDVAARLRRAERLVEVEGHAKGLSSAPQVPTHLGRYEIDGELGRGSMGTVYAARDPMIGRSVALKTLALSSEFEGPALVDARARFFREAESAGRLQHPQIVAIYDVGDQQGLSWIAMERLLGRDLAYATQSEQLLAVPTVLSIAARVADALDYAHQHRVVHRDIKPSNILYDAETDNVKVTDFGIARITDNSKTRTGLVLGTPSFMAPEQIMGVKADGRCDIYALGVTLYQLLTGSLPLRAESMSALMQAIARQVPADVRTLRAELPESVAALVARALQKNPDARFQTGAQMAQALRVAAAHMESAFDSHSDSALDYDGRTDSHKYPMADYQDTVLESAPAPLAYHDTGPRI